MTAARPAEPAGPSALDLVARRALDRLVALPGVLRAGFAVSEGGRRHLLFTATDRGTGSGDFEWCRIDLSWDVPLNRAARDGELVAGTLEELDVRFPSFVRGQRDTPVRRVAAVPVTHDDEHLGGFVLYLDRDGSVDPASCAELEEIGRSIGSELAGARRDRRRSAPATQHADAGSTLCATHEMPGELPAVGAARRFLRTTLEGWGLHGDPVDDAVLCLDELVTNAVVHTHAGCWVRASLAEGVLRVQVVDHGGLGPIRLVPTAEETAAHGRGLQIVEALASRTGRDDAECLSWFEVDLPEATRPHPV